MLSWLKYGEKKSLKIERAIWENSNNLAPKNWGSAERSNGKYDISNGRIVIADTDFKLHLNFICAVISIHSHYARTFVKSGVSFGHSVGEGEEGNEGIGTIWSEEWRGKAAFK